MSGPAIRLRSSPATSGCLESWSGLLGGGRLLLALFLGRSRAFLIDCHQNKVADDTITAVRDLHRTAWSRIGSVELGTGPVGMLEDGTEVPDTDDDVELVWHLNVVKFVHLHGDGRVERLLQNS